ncbi:hypothetical protein OJAV_G00078410 [Oryzias javanicus]|uniref:Uncharacterized protein n=1 Tax=Oryzias javanicus TaxID=123683 RepID=A0A3S2M7H1_ORYJA|nr:hypothetical protein OJAV_G00078410 [Oryzias javanicus]
MVMAFILILWVSWLCLLFTNGIGVTNAIGDDYRLQAASRNLADHVDDFSNFLSFDEGTEEVPKPKPSRSFYTSFRKPSVTQPQNLAITGQAPPNKFGAPREKAVAGGSMKWESTLFEPISVSARQDDKHSLIPAAIQSQMAPLDTYANRDPVSQGVAVTSASSKKVPSKAFTSLSIVPPKSQSWPSKSQTGQRVGVSTVSFPKVDRGYSKPPKLLHEGAFRYNSGNAGFLPDHSLKQELPLLNPSVHAKLQDDDNSVGAKDYGQSDNFPWASSVPVSSLWKPSFQSTEAKSSPKDWMMVSPFSGAGQHNTLKLGANIKVPMILPSQYFQIKLFKCKLCKWVPFESMC